MSLPGVIGDLFSSRPEYPVVICGLDGAGKSTLIDEWHASSGKCTRQESTLFKTVTMQLAGRGKVTFRDAPSHGSVSFGPKRDELCFGGGQAGLLYVHDASSDRVDESLARLQRYIEEVLYARGGRGVWVLLSKMDLVPQSDRLRVFNNLETKFGFELCKYGSAFRWQVLALPEFSARSARDAREAFEMLAEELVQAPPRSSAAVKGHAAELASAGAAATQIEDDLETNIEMSEAEIDEWWDMFLHGQMKRKWRHVDYLRAVYMIILERENDNKGVLEIATDVATKVHDFKQRFVTFPLPPESRTLTVFWVYHVRMAIKAYGKLLVSLFRGRDCCFPSHFPNILNHMPELTDEKLPLSYFSSDLLGSKYSEQLWMLPDLRTLPELPQVQVTREKPTRRITLTNHGDPERVLRFAFAVVQRYLRKDSTQRRSWFIDLGFAAFEQRTIRLRTQAASIPVYSLTHIYFYVQMVHLALSQLLTTGTSQDDIDNISYPVFRAVSQLHPMTWTSYYSNTKWFSLEARVQFSPPDLQPLPNHLDLNLQPNTPIPANDAYRTAGHIPELPSLEILNFHLAVLLSAAQSLPSPLPPSSVTSHPALLSYLHTHIISPSKSRSPSESSKSITHHLTLLSQSTPYSLPHLTFWTSQSLSALSSTSLPDRNHLYLPIHPPLHSLPWKPSGVDPATDRWTRYHNCPCHYGITMNPQIGPSAVSYPFDYPYEHPPQRTHSCACHKGEEIDHDRFAELCGEGYARRELEEKRSRGLVAGVRTLSSDPWENFMRFNAALAWEGLWGVWYSRGAWEGGGEADLRGLEGQGWMEKGKEDGIGEGGEAKVDGVNEGMGKLSVDEEEDEDWEVVV
ncbi:hypothetical protein QBC34DRAFT_468476 [Podospora aff. communis PSN243]|uniref:Uncharacterized protein n=1 Tax=Podospora aff. communis PSN243 TaxID=3040156 RepID=A0AAV9GFD7_9PEZI|nr:hypothetical protein QBC34DRAFT_468476 [Podospora aff. communis PSN243]